MATSICRGCSKAAVSHGYCDSCKQIRTLRPKRKINKQWGKRINPYPLDGDIIWIKLRKDFIKRNPLCVRHRLANKSVSGKHVDHIISVRQRPDLKYDEGNLQTLCHSCHSIKTGYERQGVFIDYVQKKKYLL